MYTGVGLGKIASFLRGGFGQLWAFDSFQGIPEEPASENEALWTGDFRQGGYSAADALGVYDLESLVANIHQRVRRPNTTYVPGFFNVSLTDSLIRRAAGEGRPFQPALFVDVDVRAHLAYRRYRDRYRWYRCRNRHRWYRTGTGAANPPSFAREYPVGLWMADAYPGHPC